MTFTTHDEALEHLRAIASEHRLSAAVQAPYAVSAPRIAKELERLTLKNPRFASTLATVLYGLPPEHPQE